MLERESPWIPGAMLAPWIILAGATFPISPSIAIGLVITGALLSLGWSSGTSF